MNYCVECKVNTASHWGKHLCEDCFREILREAIENEGGQETEDAKSAHNSSHAISLEVKI